MTIISALAVDTIQQLTFGLMSIDDPRDFEGRVQDIYELGIFGYTATLTSDAPTLFGIKADTRDQFGVKTTDRQIEGTITFDEDFFNRKTN